MSLRGKLDGIAQIWAFDNRYRLILDRVLSPSESSAVYKFKGYSLATQRETGDVVAVREVLATDTYRRYLSGMDLEGPLNVLDIGSNIGAFPVLLLSENYKLKKLACVELNPSTFEKMKANVGRNVDCEFHPINAAVCARNEDLDLQLGAGALSDNIYGEQVTSGKTYHLQGRTFDSIYDEVFGDETVDLCKIDIEGAEFEIFRSDTCKRLADCRYLLMEIHHCPQRDRTEVIETLRQMHFTEVDGDNKADESHYVHFFVNIHAGD